MFAHAKTKAQISCAVAAQLISAFVFATRIEQFLLFLNPKFQASSLFSRLYRSVCVRSEIRKAGFLTSWHIYNIQNASDWKA